MTVTFDEIRSLHQDIILLINETINKAMSIASLILFSFWLIGGIGILVFLEQFFATGSLVINTWNIVWLFGFIIILVPGILEYLILLLFARIVINKHYRIIEKLEQEFYEIDEVKQIPYKLNSARRLNSILKQDGILFDVVIYTALYLEKRGIIANLKGENNHTAGMNKVIFGEANLIIERKKRIILSLIEKIKIMEATLMLELMLDLRSDLSYRISEQQSILQKANSEVSIHIHGTTELNQVSELQGARLDKQIEQFKELQRVLVRV